MDIEKLPIGENPPKDVNLVVEVAMRSDPVKYELDKVSRALVVDRFLQTAMSYPGNYGFIPHTLSDDGDPVDVLAVGKLPVIPGAVMRVRPIGVLLMEDEAGQDEKVLAVPHPKLKPFYDDVTNYDQLHHSVLDEIEHFFSQYKALEPGKWVKVKGWADVKEAEKVITDAIARAGNAPGAAA
ncbi:MAG: inorganic diphosphatase [Pseudomonadota bacterium]